MLKNSLFKNIYEIFKKIQHYILIEKPNHKIIGYNVKNDPIKTFDLQSEKIIINHILSVFPESRILSEESGFINEFLKNPEYTFIIDPIDGSNNVSLGIPFFGVSIAIIKGNKDITCSNIDYAFIGNITNGDYFTAIKGHGAFKNNEPLAKKKDKYDSCIVLHLKIPTYYDKYKEICYNICSKFSKIQHIRILGSSVIELAYVIEGKIFAYIDLRGSLTAENFLAAYLILNESGGVMERIFPNKDFTKIKKLNTGFSILALSEKKYINEFKNILNSL